MAEEKITHLGATATEHDTQRYAETATSGDQTSYAERQRDAQPELQDDCTPDATQDSPAD